MNEIFIVARVEDEYPEESLHVEVFTTLSAAHAWIDFEKADIGFETMTFQIHRVDLSSNPSSPTKEAIYWWSGNSGDVEDEREIDAKIFADD